jgi:hypothetical protein
MLETGGDESRHGEQHSEHLVPRASCADGEPHGEADQYIAKNAEKKGSIERESDFCYGERECDSCD